MSLVTYFLIIVLLDVAWFYVRGGVEGVFVLGFVAGQVTGAAMAVCYSLVMGSRARLWPSWRRRRGPRAVR